MASARITGTNENIKTLGNGTRDYTVPSTWESDTDNDLVTSQVSEVLEVYNDLTITMSGLTMNGATTNASYRRIMRPASGQKHDGTPNTGAHLQCTGTGMAIQATENYISVQDLIISHTGSSTTNLAATATGVPTTELSIIGCIAYNITNPGSGAGQGFRCVSNSDNNYVIDCIVMGSEQRGITSSTGTGTAYIYNTTIVGSGEAGVFEATGSLICKNVLSTGNTGLAFESFSSSGHTNNASNDATAIGTSARTNQTFTFVNSGSNDYHLSASDTGARGHGANLSSDPNFAFDDDIDKETITTWSIGADSIAAALSGFGDLIGQKRNRLVRI